ncbi:hypothetical protein PanWU01x14_012750, partial [Parasponia andersonii]
EGVSSLRLVFYLSATRMFRVRSVLSPKVRSFIKRFGSHGEIYGELVCMKCEPWNLVGFQLGMQPHIKVGAWSVPHEF